jgi:DNA topoisomerase-1
VTWDKPVARACPDCGAFLVEKKNRGKMVLKCSRKDCEYVEELEPRGETEE